MELFEETFTKTVLFKEHLKQYAIEHTAGNDYHIAMRWMNFLLDLSHKNKVVLSLLNKWLTKGHTLTLKELLAFIGYEDPSLSHFNTMCYLDSRIIKFLEK